MLAVLLSVYYYTAMPGCSKRHESLNSRRVWYLGGYSFLCVASSTSARPLPLLLPQTALTLVFRLQSSANGSSSSLALAPARISFIETPGHLRLINKPTHAHCSVSVLARLLRPRHIHT